MFHYYEHHTRKMKYDKVLNSLKIFTEKLMDEESRQLYDARFCYMINRDKNLFYEKLDSILVSRE